MSVADVTNRYSGSQLTNNEKAQGVHLIEQVQRACELSRAGAYLEALACLDDVQKADPLNPSLLALKERVERLYFLSQRGQLSAEEEEGFRRWLEHLVQKFENVTAAQQLLSSIFLAPDTGRGWGGQKNPQLLKDGGTTKQDLLKTGEDWIEKQSMGSPVPGIDLRDGAALERDQLLKEQMKRRAERTKTPEGEVEVNAQERKDQPDQQPDQTSGVSLPVGDPDLKIVSAGVPVSLGVRLRLSIRRLRLVGVLFTLLCALGGTVYVLIQVISGRYTSTPVQQAVIHPPRTESGNRQPTGVNVEPSRGSPQSRTAPGTQRSGKGPAVENVPAAAVKALRPKSVKLRRANIAGRSGRVQANTVNVRVYVDADGRPLRAEIVNSTNPLFNDASIEAAMKHAFSPGSPGVVILGFIYR